MCVWACVHLSVSRCAHAVRAAILEVKWLQEEHLIALKGPPPVTSSPKLNFLGASASISSKIKWRLSLLATLQSKMGLRFAVNSPAQTMQRSLLIYRARKLVLCMFELSFCEVIELGINFYYLSYLSLLSLILPFPPLFSCPVLSYPILLFFFLSSFLSSPPLRVYGAVSMAFI